MRACMDVRDYCKDTQELLTLTHRLWWFLSLTRQEINVWAWCCHLYAFFCFFFPLCCWKVNIYHYYGMLVFKPCQSCFHLMQEEEQEEQEAEEAEDEEGKAAENRASTSQCLLWLRQWFGGVRQQLTSAQVYYYYFYSLFFLERQSLIKKAKEKWIIFPRSPDTSSIQDCCLFYAEPKATALTNEVMSSLLSLSHGTRRDLPFSPLIFSSFSEPLK